MGAAHKKNLHSSYRPAGRFRKNVKLQLLLITVVHVYIAEKQYKDDAKMYKLLSFRKSSFRTSKEYFSFCALRLKLHLHVHVHLQAPAYEYTER